MTFEHVTFAYPAGPPVLVDVDLHIDAGTRVARKRRLAGARREKIESPAIENIERNGLVATGDGLSETVRLTDACPP